MAAATFAALQTCPRADRTRPHDEDDVNRSASQKSQPLTRCGGPGFASTLITSAASTLPQGCGLRERSALNTAVSPVSTLRNSSTRCESAAVSLPNHRAHLQARSSGISNLSHAWLWISKMRWNRRASPGLSESTLLSESILRTTRCPSLLGSVYHAGIGISMDLPSASATRHSMLWCRRWKTRTCVHDS